MRRLDFHYEECKPGSNREVSSNGSLVYTEFGKYLEDRKKIDPLKNKTLSMLLKAGSLCNNSNLTKDYKIIGDPTEGALEVLAAKFLNTEDLEKECPRISEYPFTSERKRMETVNRIDGKNYIFSKGLFGSYRSDPFPRPQNTYNPLPCRNLCKPDDGDGLRLWAHE